MPLDMKQMLPMCYIIMIFYATSMFAQTVHRSGDLMFSLYDSADGNYAEVIGNLINKESQLTIPSNVNVDGLNYEVRSIGPEAFRECNFIYQVILPNTIKTIGRAAFYDCSNLIDFQMGEGVEEIDDNAFKFSRLKTISLSKELKRIGKYAFANGGPDQIIVPPNVNFIDEWAFYGFRQKIAIPQNVQYKSTSFMGMYTTGLITYDPLDCCIEDDCLYNSDKTILLFVPNNYDTYDINPNVVKIGKSAFFYDTNLKHVDLKNVNDIDRYAFSDCWALSDISFPKELNRIGEEAFSNCRSIKSINLPEGISIIEKSAFHSCQELTSITIPSTVTELGDYAFMKSVYQDSCKIREVYYNTILPVTASKNIFSEDVYRDAYLYINENGYDITYKTIPWAYFHTIKIHDFANIKNIRFNEDESIIKIYNINGCSVGNQVETLPSGIYVIYGKKKSKLIKK